VAAMQLGKASLDLQPVLNTDLVEQLEDEFETTLEVARGETAIAMLGWTDEVATLIIMILSIVFPDLKRDSIMYIFLHKIILNLPSILSDYFLQLPLTISGKST
jgi:hypothetical protein